MTLTGLTFPEPNDLAPLVQALSDLIADVSSAKRPIPASVPPVAEVPQHGRAAEKLPEIWQMIADGAAQLGTPFMSGHMDTAPHPYAALTSALVAALNNNLLFQELSPFASAVEEAMIDHFISCLALGDGWTGTWASGGSIANLTALFAAVGGYARSVNREDVWLFLPESGHTSLSKSAAVLGLAPDQVIKLRCDDAGRMDVAALKTALAAIPASAKPVVTAVLGTTIHGSVDDISAIGEACRERDAWLHVDAIYGGALMYSHVHRRFLRGVEHAQSIVIGPQKWMYVPRVSAAVLIKGRERFDDSLGVAMPYSMSGARHRGYWGVQGSRPADAVVLWALLQMVGTDAMGVQIDTSIALTSEFHALLTASQDVWPAHVPDLNLQVIGTRNPAACAQRHLEAAGGLWTSLAEWRGQKFLRCVLLSPALEAATLHQFVASLQEAVSRGV